MKKAQSLQKMVFFKDFGKGRIVTEEINILSNEEKRLEQLRIDMKHSLKSENEYWKKSFASDFLERLSYIRRNKKDGNKILAKLTKEFLVKRKRILTPLEHLLKELEGEE